MQSSTDAIYTARHVGLKSGIPISAGSLLVNRLCGSGFQSVISAAQEILLGLEKFLSTSLLYSCFEPRFEDSYLGLVIFFNLIISFTFSFQATPRSLSLLVPRT